ncbi:ornithine carbamoyltransferase [Pandoraea nosoerga]|uniref:Aspartate/ornithine carbamoyltransferase, Asp/Orn-binding region n=1 Tax=Pandoraea nosoerga TaxID=2508296 RepID=A0A5E4RRJ8_9BURK|nr:ornithine carbamoyltransferase [Pandoraea nosoerga]MBN4664595.1 ornithine carbamoyltransferase [Pandoraea nosoerga]MBN4674370.1 ornithine carbamoyltransferase [Pandoraea nosoerga]MBN4679638.1 ornithine carbamoyltransferase [Pandoraea nosoerga]MBN4743273.1 ornithine carbamoyltransferase [Pandoraea nosoerga]VVD65655.1 aspartate/ornithine carbamoyltransferase, Asp/Orn-binding region [Pandoraea nosoerga]
MNSHWLAPDMTMSAADYLALLDAALAFKQRYPAQTGAALQGKTIYFLFYNASLRTRSSFQTGLARMGGNAIVLDPHHAIYTPALPEAEIPYTTERIADVARVLSSYGDAIAIRMYGEPAGWVYGAAHRHLEAFARSSRVPVINMECDRFHPCQALADMMTLRERLGDLAGRRLCISWAYSGSWHKPVAVPQSLLLAAAKAGMDITLAHPASFGLDPEVMDRARQVAGQTGARVRVTHDFLDGVNGAQAVYAKSWCCLAHLPTRHGDPVDERAMQRAFERHRDWRVDADVMRLSGTDAGYLHCLPADRGQEVTDEVIDGASSWVFQQAANRLHAQNAVMARLLNPGCLA